MEKGGLLEINEYYILMVNTWENKDGETIETSDLDRIISLGKSYENLENKIVAQYKIAYKNQEVPLNFKKSGISKFDFNYKEGEIY